jgi:hypothetical protein
VAVSLPVVGLCRLIRKGAKRRQDGSRSLWFAQSSNASSKAWRSQHLMAAEEGRTRTIQVVPYRRKLRAVDCMPC